VLVEAQRIEAKDATFAKQIRAERPDAPRRDGA
jgi:hypothetical protein